MQARAKRSRWVVGLVVSSVAGAAGVVAGCDNAPIPEPTLAPARSAVVESGARIIRREIFEIEGSVPIANPTGGATTPPEQNKLRVARFRLDGDTPKPARAIFVLVPGFLAGAASYDGLARAIVRRSTDAEAYEAWAIDRRSNLLEDSRGVDFAEVMQSSKAGFEYYFDDKEIAGKRFAGFLTGPEAPWASEWGMATTVADIKKVVELVPAGERKGRVVLVGHSMGATMAEAFAAWDFGRPGHEEIAALALVDGVARNEGVPAAEIDRTRYEKGSTLGGFPSPGVEAIRAGNTFVALPLLGVEALAVAELMAIDATHAPTAPLTENPARDRLLSIALGMTTLPKLTNASAFGLALDEGTAPLTFAAARCGASTGGPLSSYVGPLGEKLLHPSDSTATYLWTDGPAVGEPTRLVDLASGWFAGPGINFPEWYFPQRLSLDATVVGTLDIDDADWRSAVYGLRAKHGRTIDIPIFGAAFRLLGSVSTFDRLRAFVKTPPASFTTKLYPELSHIDGLVGADTPGGAATSFYDDLVAFGARATVAGGVVVPVR